MFKGIGNCAVFYQENVIDVLALLHRCFLLTPKLLPNLEYSEACSILTVMNGPWIEESSKGWILLQAQASLVPLQFIGAYLLAFYVRG